MEPVLIFSIIVDFVMAVYMLTSIIYLSNKDRKIESDLDAIKEIVEMNSILISNRNNSKKNIWS